MQKIVTQNTDPEWWCTMKILSSKSNLDGCFVLNRQILFNHIIMCISRILMQNFAAVWWGDISWNWRCWSVVMELTQWWQNGWVLQNPVDSGRSGIRGFVEFPDGHGFQPSFHWYFGGGVRYGFLPCDDKCWNWFCTFNSSVQSKIQHSLSLLQTQFLQIYLASNKLTYRIASKNKTYQLKLMSSKFVWLVLGNFGEYQQHW